MKNFLSDQSSDAVVNYSSSYGGFLFRSPNSPPPSPSPDPSPATASLSQLFLGARPVIHGGSRAAAYYSSPSGCFQLRQPPLLPFPRSATLPSTNKCVPAAIQASSFRSRRKNSKRKGKMFVGAMNGTDEVKPVVEIKVTGKDESRTWTMKAKPNEKEESRSPEPKVIEQRDEMESVYSQSPPPSSLPFPKFSMTRPKANVGVAGTLAGTLAGSCIAENTEAAGCADDL